VFGADDFLTLESDMNLATCLRDENKLDEAIRFAQSATDGASSRFGPDDPQTRRYRAQLNALNSPPR